MRLIDADALLKHAGIFEVKACARGCGNSILNFAKAWLWNEVNIAPTIDAVHVVRCRDCQHWKPSGSKAGNSFSDMEYIGGCEFTNYYRRESDFCSYGERKEGADNDT